MNRCDFKKSVHVFMAGLCIGFVLCGSSLGKETDWFARKSDWNGYDRFHFKVDNQAAYIVAPKEVAAGKPWIWRARFPGYHAEMDIKLVAKGFHIGYVEVGGLFGGPRAIEIGEKFYEFATLNRGLSQTPVMEGVSRGGLFVYNWTAKNPEKVNSIYCDTPVCDIKSWPGGKGNGVGAKNEWQQCLKAYSLTETEAETYAMNPVDARTASIISKAKIPILHIVSENDRIVPPKENTYLLKQRIEVLGHSMQIISVPEGTEKSSGHHFTHPDPDQVVEFVLASVKNRPAPAQMANPGERMEVLKRARRVVFLGDSITQQGTYITRFDTWLTKQKLRNPPTVINVGLSSETVSGLSEDGHAGGRFPRPHLAERLERVLNLTKPDLVFACYGINCGIYQPFHEDRFDAYKTGIKNLKRQVENAGGRLVLITPPSFDDKRAKKDFSYNAVLDKYSEWLVAQREIGWSVIDLHSTMTEELKSRRIDDADFTFQPDSVHPNDEGHNFMASQLIAWFGGNIAEANDPEIGRLVGERMQLLRNSYLFVAGHKRPGVGRGLPVAWAKDRAGSVTEQIQAVLSRSN